MSSTSQQCWSIGTFFLGLAIYAVSGNTRLARSVVEKTVFGELGTTVKLQCVLPTNGTTITFIEWRFAVGNENKLIYFDSTKSTGNTGSKDKFIKREVKGSFGHNGTLHHLEIKKTVPTDEGSYTCRMRDSLKVLYSKTTKLVLVVLPAHPPAIVSQNGTQLSTIDCDNITGIPSVVIGEKTTLGLSCEVGKSEPASKVSWERTFPVKEATVAAGTKRTMIDVGPLSNFLLKCTVMTPSINNANFTIQHICLRITQRQDVGLNPRFLWPTLLGVLIAIFVILIIIIVIITICWRRKCKIGIRCPFFHGKRAPSSQKRKNTQDSPKEEKMPMLTPEKEKKRTQIKDQPDHSSPAKRDQVHDSDKYDPQLASECLQWIKEVINSQYEDKVDFNTNGDKENFYSVLKSGWHLARFVNVLSPGIPVNLLSKEEKKPFKQRDVIGQFLQRVNKYNIRDHEKFETVDLFEQRNLHQVVICLEALGRKARELVQKRL